ncbi:MAG: glycine--tRNA ligase subunit beta [Cyanobacteriota bacterium]|nr:glycine--tRNA ligase subunit beta [Cyanobacteriota bacterium]
MASFLLEIGTEELPADFVRLAIPQLECRLGEDLAQARLPYAALRATGTPRRLAVCVEGLPTRQEDVQQELKGPPVQQAFRDGRPTPAAEGFAKRCGLTVEQLEVRDTAKGPFLFASTREPGRATEEVLADLLPGWIWSLQGRRFMRWGQGESRFSRPVRWLVALLDRDVIPVRLHDCDPSIESGRDSQGHRLWQGPVTIPAAESYTITLEGAGVLVDRGVRAQVIRDQLTQAAAREAARLDCPESLFEELVDLVEQPLVIMGSMDPTFLALPPEVLSTVMRAHQRYVPLLNPEASNDPLALSAEKVLLPRFLCVSNGLPEAATPIRRGNERVLRARLADAAFFLEADHAVASIDRREALAQVTFAEGLGSLRDRTERLEWCTDVLLEALPGLRPETPHHARRAAHLCKNDLVSQMVGEFPELQGIMGAKYLLAEGEDRAVARAVLEHYQPRSATDDLPMSEAGAVLALAERFELLLSIFSKGERPSGSSDPYGLRRAGNGLVQILWKQQWELNINTFLARAAKQWLEEFLQRDINANDLCTGLGELLRQRVGSLLLEEGLNQDIVQAVAGSNMQDQQRILTNVCDVRARADLLQALRNRGNLSQVQSVVQRAARLAEKGSLARDVLRVDGVIDPELFEAQSEAAMHSVLSQLSPMATSVHRYEDLAQALAESQEVLTAFFDGPDSVLVMCEDMDKRNNRLNMLGVLRNQAMVLADFNQLSNE